MLAGLNTGPRYLTSTATTSLTLHNSFIALDQGAHFPSGVFHPTATAAVHVPGPAACRALYPQPPSQKCPPSCQFGIDQHSIPRAMGKCLLSVLHDGDPSCGWHILKCQQLDAPPHEVHILDQGHMLVRLSATACKRSCQVSSFHFPLHALSTPQSRLSELHKDVLLVGAAGMSYK